MRSLGTLLVAIGCLSVTIASAQVSNQFIALGDLPAGISGSSPFAVSGDGAAVAGWGRSSSGREAWIWQRGSGLMLLGDLPGGGFESMAFGISDDATVVVGNSESGLTSNAIDPVVEAFHWTAAAGLQGLGTLGESCVQEFCFESSRAAAVSGDGSVIGGSTTTTTNAGGRAMLWTETNGMQILDLGLGLASDVSGRVNALSADGSSAVGRFIDGGMSKAYLWNQASGVTILDGVSPGTRVSAIDLSSDGSVVVGHLVRPGTTLSEGFRWTEAGGYEFLGFLEILPTAQSSFVDGVSGDGTVIVGNARVSASGLFDRSQAFIWDQAQGMRNLKLVLATDYGLDLTGWGTLRAEAISTDGQAIVGFGINPQGESEAWLALLHAGPVESVPTLGPAGPLVVTLLLIVAAIRGLGNLTGRINEAG